MKWYNDTVQNNMCSKFRLFWNVAVCSHVEVDRRFRYALCLNNQALMMEAVRTSETSVNFNVSTWPYILEEFKLHTRQRENLKTQICVQCGNSPPSCSLP
jgi:hypothetical protein